MLARYLFPLSLILYESDAEHPLPDNECNACISQNINDHVEFSTPPDEEIIFSKIIREDTVYKIKFMMNCVDFEVRDSSVYMNLTNNRQIGRPRVPVGVKMSKSTKHPFILTAAFDLNRQEIIILKNFGIKSFAIGNQKYLIENKKQKTFTQYFKCLVGAGIEKNNTTDFPAQVVEKAAKKTGYDFSVVQQPAIADELYSLPYSDFVMSLVKAMQELRSEVKNLKSEINYLKSDSYKSAVNNPLPKEPYGKSEILFQNVVNPFNSETEIKFQLPAKFNSAILVISDENGKQLRTYNVQSLTPVIIKAGALSAGTYSYLLIIDGSPVDSKQMVLTK